MYVIAAVILIPLAVILVRTAGLFLLRWLIYSVAFGIATFLVVGLIRLLDGYPADGLVEAAYRFFTEPETGAPLAVAFFLAVGGLLAWRQSNP